MLNLAVSTLTGRSHLTFSVLTQLTLLSSFTAVGLNTRQLLLNLAGNSGNIGVALGLQGLLIAVMCGLQVRQILVTSFLVHARDHVGGEVDDLLQVLRCQIQQVPQAGGNTLEVPDVGDGGSQLNVAHTLTAHL